MSKKTRRKAPNPGPTAEAKKDQQLIKAVVANNSRAAETALDQGANPNLVLKGITPLHIAVSLGNQCIIAALIRCGGDIKAPGLGGLTPLHTACTAEQLACARQLLDAGADVHVLDRQGFTPLHHVAYGSQRQQNPKVTRQLIQLLLQRGARINQKSFEGFTPLHIACNAIHDTAALELIAQGADVQATNGEDGITALHLVEHRASYEVVRALIAAGADVNAQSRVLQTPLNRATYLRGNKSALALLAAGADPESDMRDGALETACENEMLFVIQKMLESARTVRTLTEDITAEALIAAFETGLHPGAILRSAPTHQSVSV